MARKLKPVAETPISDPASLKRIDPFWRHRRVPEGFWDDPQNRRDYLLSSAKTFRLRVMRDLYRLDLKQCYKRNRGSRLADHWDYLPYKAVQDIFPQYDWKPWLFKAVSKEFWKVRANRRSYLDWLGKQLGFRRPQDWYRIRISDIAARHGRGLLNQVPLPALMRSYLPRLDWDRVFKQRRLSVKQILQWADAYHARRGDWPTTRSGPIPKTTDNWLRIDRGLRNGLRGLRGGSSLARLLEKHRGVRYRRTPPPLSEDQVLAWADAHFAAHGKWPAIKSGPIPGTRETWNAIDAALGAGRRGFPGHSSLARLLALRRGKRNRQRLPRLTVTRILAWADEYFDAHGKWPIPSSGPIGITGETWATVGSALEKGRRGLQGKSSLTRLLAERRGMRNHKRLPPLSENQILAWADAYYSRHGIWPIIGAGPVAGATETWSTVSTALKKGDRGLPRRSSLPRLLAERRGVPMRRGGPRLTEQQILGWAKAHRKVIGRLPNRRSGPVMQSLSENWKAIDRALEKGRRGLPGGSSLEKLLRKNGLR